MYVAHNCVTSDKDCKATTRKVLSHSLFKVNMDQLKKSSDDSLLHVALSRSKAILVSNVLVGKK